MVSGELGHVETADMGGDRLVASDVRFDGPGDLDVLLGDGAIGDPGVGQRHVADDGYKGPRNVRVAEPPPFVRRTRPVLIPRGEILGRDERWERLA